MVDVMESVIRSSGFIKPMSAIEKIITSAITIGSGGSTGAEGPIIQIGAGIASGVGSFIRTGSAIHANRHRLWNGPRESARFLTRRSVACSSRSKSFCRISPSDPSRPS